MEPKLAGRLGLEPRLAGSKAAVLPLDDPPINYDVYCPGNASNAGGVIQSFCIRSGYLCCSATSGFLMHSMRLGAASTGVAMRTDPLTAVNSEAMTSFIFFFFTIYSILKLVGAIIR